MASEVGRSKALEVTPSLRLEWVDPSTLQEHPSNWKHHPPEQVQSIDGLFSEVGWAGALLFNETTGHLLDGHARRSLAIAKGGPVPVLIGSWSEEQERLILTYLDPTGWTAVADRAKLNELLKGKFPEIKNAEMASLLEAVKSTSKLLDPAGPEGSRKEDDALEVSLPLDSLWPTDNAWAVPTLLPELAADQVPAPVTTWGTIGARRPMAGTWHFYTRDSRFEPLWKRPHRVLYSRPSAIVEPNFSTTDQTPFAVSLWHIYRKRWLARYWQAQGLKVLVDLNVDAELNAPHPGCDGRRPNLLGVPSGWAAFSSRAHADRPESLVVEWEVARAHSGREHPLFLVVGGGKAVRSLAQEHGWVWVPEQVQEAHPEKGTDES